MFHCIHADQQRQLYAGHLLIEFGLPERRALRTWRQVAAFGILTGETESHWRDCKVVGVIESCWIDAEPIPQPATRWIGEGQGTGMRERTWSLTDNTNF